MNSKISIVQSRLQPSHLSTNIAKNNIFLSSVCNALASPYTSQFSFNNSSSFDDEKSAFSHIPTSSNSLIHHESLPLENSKIINFKSLDNNKRKQNFASNLNKQLTKEIKKNKSPDNNMLSNCGTLSPDAAATASRLSINARERRRMHDLNDAMDDLRSVIPYVSLTVLYHLNEC